MSLIIFCLIFNCLLKYIEMFKKTRGVCGGVKITKAKVALINTAINGQLTVWSEREGVKHSQG